MTLAYALGLIAAFMVGGTFGMLAMAIAKINEPFNPPEDTEEQY